MANLEKLNFIALTIGGGDYLSWVLDLKAHLAAKELKDTITTDQGIIEKQKAKALTFIRHHLIEPLYKSTRNFGNSFKIVSIRLRQSIFLEPETIG